MAYFLFSAKQPPGVSPLAPVTLAGGCILRVLLESAKQPPGVSSLEPVILAGGCVLRVLLERFAESSQIDRTATGDRGLRRHPHASRRLAGSFSRFIIWFSIILALTVPRVSLAGTKIRDLSSVEGVRDNQLIGYGLVVGLNGTGDKRQTVFSAQSLANLLERMGVSVSPTAFQVRNMAAVMVTATMPAYAQTGSRIDVTVSAIGDASNLQGGILLMTPLKAADGQIYSAAQGPVVTGGFSAGKGGNTQTVNHPTVGRIVAGALVERLVTTTALDGSEVRLQVRRPDSAAAAKMAAAINAHFQQSLAKPINPGLVSVTVPPLFHARRVEFLGEIQELPVETETRSRIIINERTGTIIMGKDVAIAPVSILHGALAVEIQTQFSVSQPNPLSAGQTVTVPERKVQAKEEKARNVTLKQGATVEDLVRGLQAIGATPRDIIAILDGLRSSGALEAEIEVI